MEDSLKGDGLLGCRRNVKGRSGTRWIYILTVNVDEFGHVEASMYRDDCI